MVIPNSFANLKLNLIKPTLNQDSTLKNSLKVVKYELALLANHIPFLSV